MKQKEIIWELRIAIVRKFFSQVAAARELGIRESRLSYLLHGHAQPTRMERELLAKALGGELVDRAFPLPQSTKKKIKGEQNDARKRNFL